ncbi:unnamed protein product, partial [Effrenium voratum]
GATTSLVQTLHGAMAEHSARASRQSRHQLDKAKETREQDENFERSVHVTSLKEEDFANVLGADWRVQRPTKIDFSSDKYLLDTLEGPSGGLLHPKLTRSRVQLIDLSNNNLMDLSALNNSGFDALQTIMARKNLISRISSLVLPSLVELNLAYNALRVMPSLGGLPALEVLIL